MNSPVTPDRVNKKLSNSIFHTRDVHNTPAVVGANQEANSKHINFVVFMV